MEHRGLYAWAEWEDLCRSNAVQEPSEIFTNPEHTGIGCGNFNVISGGVCGAHLIHVIDPEGKHIFVQNGKRVWVYCSVCGWDGTRAVGKKSE